MYGLVDPAKMWAEFDNEDFTPILVGGKAVISIWFNDFKDTDCGGSYLETWYNTFVTPKVRAILRATHCVHLCLVSSLLKALPRREGTSTVYIMSGMRYATHPVYTVPGVLYG